MSAIYVVRQGECLTSIAGHHGFADYRQVYDSAENAAFRKLRPDPNLLLPGDEIVIPDRADKSISCAGGARYRFVARIARRKLRVVLDLPDGRDLTGESFQLTASGQDITGTVGPSNIVEVVLPFDASTAVLTLLGINVVIRLAVGHLDPVRDGEGGRAVSSGVLARLHNLGYSGSAGTGDPDAELAGAVKRFQEAAMGRTIADGTLDDETLDQLLSEHGC